MERAIGKPLKYLLAFAFPFLVYFARDLAHWAHPLTLLSTQEYIELAAYLKKPNNYIFGALLHSGTAAAVQRLPFHPSYTLELMQTLYPNVHLLWYLILPVIFLISKVQDIYLSIKRKKLDLKALFNPLERMIVFIAIITIGSALIHAYLGLVIVARAFLPYILLLIFLQFMLLQWTLAAVQAKNILYGRTITTLFAAVTLLFFILNTNFMKIVLEQKPVLVNERARAMENPFMESNVKIRVSYNFAKLRAFLESYQRSGIKELIVPPSYFMIIYSIRYQDEGKLCSLALLKDMATNITRREVLNDNLDRVIVLYMNEHVYFRMKKNIETAPIMKIISDIDQSINNSFSYRHEYSFQVDELIDILDNQLSPEWLYKDSCRTLYFQNISSKNRHIE